MSQRLTPSQTSKCQDLFTAKDEIIQQKDIIMQKYVCLPDESTNSQFSCVNHMTGKILDSDWLFRVHLNRNFGLEKAKIESTDRISGEKVFYFCVRKAKGRP